MCTGACQVQPFNESAAELSRLCDRGRLKQVSQDPVQACDRGQACAMEPWPMQCEVTDVVPNTNAMSDDDCV